ncbi:MAG: flavodoxin domain-containing protein, partial [Desulfovibrionaceae bacterium]
MRILVLFYSMYGHNEAMARAACQGVREAGAEPVLRRVPETLPDEILEKMGALEAQKQWADVPTAEIEALIED